MDDRFIVIALVVVVAVVLKLEDRFLRGPKSPPLEPYGMLLPSLHEQWWIAHLEQYAAIVKIEQCKSSAGVRSLDDLNVIGRWRVRNRNMHFAYRVRRAHVYYRQMLGDAHFFCPAAAAKHLAAREPV